MTSALFCINILAWITSVLQILLWPSYCVTNLISLLAKFGPSLHPWNNSYLVILKKKNPFDILLNGFWCLIRSLLCWEFLGLCSHDTLSCNFLVVPLTLELEFSMCICYIKSNWRYFLILKFPKYWFVLIIFSWLNDICKPFYAKKSGYIVKQEMRKDYEKDTGGRREKERGGKEWEMGREDKERLNYAKLITMGGGW